MTRLRRWLLAVMIAGNQLANALAGGQPDEAVSSRLGNARAHGSRFARMACAALEKVDFHDPGVHGDHCDEAVWRHALRTAAAAARATTEGRR